MNQPSSYDRGYKTNKINRFLKKQQQVNEFLRLKIVIVLNFQDEKVVFIVFMSKI